MNDRGAETGSFVLSGRFGVKDSAAIGRPSGPIRIATAAMFPNGLRIACGRIDLTDAELARVLLAKGEERSTVGRPRWRRNNAKGRLQRPDFARFDGQNSQLLSVVGSSGCV